MSIRKYLKPGDSFIYKGNRIVLNGRIYNQYTDDNLNFIQQAHIAGTMGMNVYEPIEAYSEKWVTKTKKNGYWEDYESSSPIPNTRRRNDLPPIHLQWKENG